MAMAAKKQARRKTGKTLKKDTGPYEDPECPFCGKGECMEVVALGEPPQPLMYQIRTVCGFFTRPLKSKEACRVLWGTRGGKAPVKLLGEIAKMANLRVVQNPVGEVGGRVVGGEGAAARRKAELEAAASAQSAPSKGALDEAANVNRTGSRLNREMPESGAAAPF